LSEIKNQEDELAKLIKKARRAKTKKSRKRKRKKGQRRCEKSIIICSYSTTYFTAKMALIIFLQIYIMM